jgi:hypothetical protein
VSEDVGNEMQLGSLTRRLKHGDLPKTRCNTDYWYLSTVAAQVPKIVRLSQNTPNISVKYLVPT